MRLTAFIALVATLATPPGRADIKADYLELVARGWDYDYRGTARGTAGPPPPSYVMAGGMAPRAICLIGEAPHPVMSETLGLFRRLLSDVFGTAGPVMQGGADITECGTDASVFIRFYSTIVPNDLFNADISALNARFGLGLSGRQYLRILSPAQAVTMFGQDGQITHLSLLEPASPRIGLLETRFYRSLLIEELYQSYSFGIDIYKTGTGGPYLSKLQETQVDLRLLDWTSPGYMAGLLGSNPSGLCHFDAMMLHALAEYLPERNSELSIGDFVAARFDTLYEEARATAARADLGPLFDPDCAAPPPR